MDSSFHGVYHKLLPDKNKLEISNFTDENDAVTCLPGAPYRDADPTMRQPKPKEYDHYPDLELDPKSEERRAFDNAMRRYWQWKDSVPLAPNLPCSHLTEVFDQSLGDDNSYAVDASTRKYIVFHNSVSKIKMKVMEFGGPDGFVTRPLSENQCGCKAVVFDDRLHPTEVHECLSTLSPDLVLDSRSEHLDSAANDMWLLVL